MADPLKLQEVFEGRRLLFTGATGFLGKVTLSLLLSRYSQIGEVLVLARRGARGSAEQRVFGEVLPSEPFRPLREQHGAGTDAFLRSKIRVLDGDVSEPNLGLSDPAALGKVDLVLNCAGLVSFNPSLQLALEANSLGALHAAQLAVALAAPLLHVSTCFVAGRRDGAVFEDEPILGEYPNREGLSGIPMDPEAEIRDCLRLIERSRAEADDLTLAAGFRQRAVDRLRDEGRADDDTRALRLAMGRERKLWLTQELVRIGMQRAERWGWPNTYTFTKALAEQVIVAAGVQSGLRYAIARPSIVESALRFPFPGWNEGFTTCAPLAFLGLKGHRSLPAGERNILDLIPVDLVAAGILGIAGATLAGRQSPVYQLASGDKNPFYAARAVELVGLYRRRVYRRRESDSRLTRAKDALASRVEMRPVRREVYELTSAPLVKRLASGARSLLAQNRPRWGAPRLDALASRLDVVLSDVERQAGQVADLIELFLPFLWDNAYVFRCDQTRALFASLGSEDRERLQWDPEALDWRHYFLDVHMFGMETWVFPGLEEERDARRRRVRAHRDLIELFYATTEGHATRVAFRLLREGDRTTVTYARFRREAERVAAFLVAAGVRQGDRVILCSENRPEWPIGFFGILLTGAVAVPLDSEIAPAAVENLRQASQARAALFSTAIAERLGAASGERSFTLDQALAPDPNLPAFERPDVDPDAPASLVFTSGTTGKPKGVLLSHRNFAQLCAKLQTTFDLRVGEGVLSVLPLHHTFEFSCGLLTPLAVGAEITYLDELTADRLGEALRTERIHALVGVPALFQLLHRRLTQELAQKPRFVEQAFKLAVAGNRELRDRMDIDLGKLLFWPVHQKLGSQLRMLVSGGSALSEEVHDAFRGLGFNLTEGYGLTEAAPVLAVTPLGEKRRTGSVGRPLPGVELRIDKARGVGSADTPVPPSGFRAADAARSPSVDEPDVSGVGEVLARGPNVMLGYFEDPAATAEVLSDGWLRTGDLGFVDGDGQLHLVGRKKDLILDASGKNIYPDELEQLYMQGAPKALRELSIVGLQDGQGGETVACLAVADSDTSEVLAHFRKVSATLPFTRRVKVLHVTGEALPRTATRKVKRPDVVAALQRLEAQGDRGKDGEPSGGFEAVRTAVASIARKRPTTLMASTRLVHDLGLDSLAFTELGAALEQAGLRVPQDLTQIQTLGELAKIVHPEGSSESTERAQESDAPDDEIAVPGPVAAIGRGLLSAGQRALYGRLFDTKITGQSYIPQNQTFLVAANHASHLDMGLIKIALGPQGELLRALGARDYFFDTPLKRAYFGNFTRVLPLDRQGSLKASLRLAGKAIGEGSHLLIFPEGTRSENGEMAEFKPTLGFLALTHGVGILPVAVIGTHRALPKGAVFPRARGLRVNIGPFLPIEQLRELSRGMPKSEAYRAVTQLAERAVRALFAGTVVRPEAPTPETPIEPPETPAEPSTEPPSLLLIKGEKS